MTTRLQRLAATYSPGEQTHLAIFKLDDPPPLLFSQNYYARYTPAGSIGIAQQGVYPRTPFLNWLARNGMQYSRATASCVCSPTRINLQTGLYAYDHGFGTVVRDGNDGDISELGDTATGVTVGEPISTTLASRCQKGFFGKLHMSKPPTDGGVGFQIIDRASGESGNGQLGNWQRRVVTVANVNNQPIPTAGTAGPQDAGVNDDGDPSNGSHYYFRYRDELQEINNGNVPRTGGADITESNSGGGTFSTTLFMRAAGAWAKEIDLAGGERMFALCPMQVCHSTFDGPPTDQVETEKCKVDPVSVWRRQNAMMEHFDNELERWWTGLPERIRNNLVIVVLADNGVDGPYLDAAINDEGFDLGADIEAAYTAGKYKQSLYRLGVGVQMIAFGPGIVPGVFDGIVEAGIDLNATIATYFGATPVGDGIALTPTWDGTQTIASWTRQSTWSGYWAPNGSPNGLTQTELEAGRTQWSALTDYALNAEVIHNGRNYTAIQDPAIGVEPGAAGTTATWREDGFRYVSFTRRTTSADALGETTGVFHLIRPNHALGETFSDVDELYRTDDEAGAPDDLWEATPVDFTVGGDYPATYALLVSEMEAQQGGFS